MQEQIPLPEKLWCAYPGSAISLRNIWRAPYIPFFNPESSWYPLATSLLDTNNCFCVSFSMAVFHSFDFLASSPLPSLVFVPVSWFSSVSSVSPTSLSIRIYYFNIQGDTPVLLRLVFLEKIRPTHCFLILYF